MPDQTSLAPITMEPVFRSYNLLLRITQVLTLQKLIYCKISFKSKRLSLFPQEYINVKKLFAEKSSTKSELWAPLYSINESIDNDSDDSELKLIDDGLNDELQWLCVVVAALDDKKFIVPGWSRYHASCKRTPIDPPGINPISPLLRDKVHTLNMQAHCMLLNINSVKVLDEGLTPVDTSDQPLFALSMEAKYRNPVLFNDYVVLFGALQNHLNFITIGLSSLTAKADVSILKERDIVCK